MERQKNPVSDFGVGATKKGVILGEVDSNGVLDIIGLGCRKTAWQDLNNGLKEVDSLDFSHENMVLVRFK